MGVANNKKKPGTEKVLAGTGGCRFLLPTLASSSSGSSGVVQAVLTLPLHSVVLISSGELPLDDVTDSF